jgi:hypothetical protein
MSKSNDIQAILLAGKIWESDEFFIDVMAGIEMEREISQGAERHLTAK